MIRAAVYCRVSTDSQEREGTSLQTQLENCLKYCQDKGYDATYRYSEAYSGLSLERPELDQLREVVRTDKINVLVIHTLDRLSRDPAHLALITMELEKHGVQLEAVLENIDTSETGKMINYIKGYAAKLDAERRREATTRGKKAHVANGRLPQGTGVGVYGYTWNKETKKREINEFEASVVRDVFERVATGESIISIARTLNQNNIPTKSKKGLWHSLTVRRIIKNTGYIGQTYFNGILLPNVTPPIVDKEYFETANKEILPKRGHAKLDYLLTGHIICAVCGKPMVGHTLGRKWRYYQCSYSLDRENRKRECPSRYVRADEVEAKAWDKTGEVMAHPDVVLSLFDEAGDGRSLDVIEDEIKALEKRLKGFEKRRTQLLKAMEFEEFDNDEILDRTNAIKRDRAEVEARLAELVKSRNSMVKLADAKVKFSKLYDRVSGNLDNADFELKRLVLDALDVKVVAGPGEPVITGVIPLELALPTIEQTSALMYFCRYSYSEATGYVLSRE